MVKTVNISLRSAIVAMLLLIGVAQMAAAVKFTATVSPSKVRVGDKFRVIYTVSGGSASGINYHEIPGATKIYETGAVTFAETNIVNGQVTKNEQGTRFTITYRADKAGKAKVEGATASVGGSTLKSNSFTVEITNAPSGGGHSGSSGGSSSPDDFFDDPFAAMQPQQVGTPVHSGDAFVRINLAKTSAYEQEAVVCSVNLYSKYDVQSLVGQEQPKFNGFLIEKIPVTPKFNRTETVNGQRMHVAEVDRYILFPQQSGDLTITSGTYDLTIVQYQRVGSRWGGYSIIPVDSHIASTTNTATLHVKPLPEPKPASFTGAVGSFTMQAKLSQPPYKTYDFAHYTLTISGTGNLKYIKAPELGFPSQFDVYEAELTPNISPAGGNLSGSVTYDYTFVPEQVGDFTLPATTFSYFDPTTGQYHTLTSQAMRISVDKGTSTAADVDKSRRQKDILAPKQVSDVIAVEGRPWVDNPLYWILLALPLVILLAAVWAYRKTLKLRADEARMRHRRAGKVARRRLRTARAFMAKKQRTEFYAEVLSALWGYLSDKLAIPVSELNKENIRAKLADYGVDDDTVASLRTLLDDCEFAQYAPSSSADDMEQIYNSAAAVMDKIETVKHRS